MTKPERAEYLPCIFPNEGNKEKKEKKVSKIMRKRE